MSSIRQTTVDIFLHVAVQSVSSVRSGTMELWNNINHFIYIYPPIRDENREMNMEGKLQKEYNNGLMGKTDRNSSSIRRRRGRRKEKGEGRRQGEMEIASAATKPLIKVAALCGSLRKASFNRGLVRSAIAICDEGLISGMQIEYIDIESLPFLNTDLEVNGKYPPVVEAFRKKIAEADSVLFASPEYNFSFSAPLKNAIDWASRPPNMWADKPAAVMSAGGGFGGGRSQYDLRKVGVFLDLHFINKPELFVPAFQPPKKFDDEGNLIDPEIKEKIRLLLLSLHAFALRLKGTC